MVQFVQTKDAMTNWVSLLLVHSPARLDSEVTALFFQVPIRMLTHIVLWRHSIY